MQGPNQQDLKGLLEALQTGGLSYEDAKSRYQQLGDAIRDRYEREITALSVDVAHSSRLKAGAPSPLDAQLAFDAYHRWVETTLAAHGCGPNEHTWAGDGLLAIFEQPEPAVAAGRALLEALPQFSARLKLGGRLTIRVGVHTGRILPGDSPGLGKIASPTFDLAGHLQKSASPGQMLISETTYTRLHEGGGQFVQVRRELPNPGVVFAYPPHTVAVHEPTIHPAPPVATMYGAQPTQPGRGGGFFLAAVAVGSAVVAAVLGTLLVLRPGKNEPAPARGPVARPPIVLGTPSPAEPAAQPAALANQPSNGPAPAPVPGRPPPAVAVPPAPAPAPAPPAWQPSRVAWRSDAPGGLPVTFVPSPPERKWLLSIGVGRYRNNTIPAAPAAGADARFMAQVLPQLAGILPTHVQLLADEQATLEAIKLALQALQRNASSGKDTIYVYLAGAAVMAPDRPDARHATGSGYAFLPTDAEPANPQATALYGSDLAAWLGATRSQTVVVFADTAFGAALDVPTAPDPGRQYGVISAGGVLQAASPTRGRQASIFAEAVAEGMRGAADADRNRRVSLEELRGFLVAQVPRRNGGVQTPEARAGFGGYLPDLTFAAGG